MSDKQSVNLTRRRVLGGLGAIGVASAGAALGTSAYFSDEESFTDNSITAGTLDMTVTATVEAANGYWEENSELPMDTTADGEPATGLQVEDVKPGDWGIICFDLEVGDNPGYVQVSTDNFESNENGFEEPEPEEGDSDGAGQLHENTYVEFYGSFDGDEDGDPRDDLEDQIGDRMSVAEFNGSLSGGQSLGEVGPESSLERCLLIEIPTEVGNVIQGDSFSFDLVFETEQVRNNDDPFSDE